MIEEIKEAILKHKRWIVLAIVIFIFVLLAEDVFENELFAFDSIIYNFLVQHRNTVLTDILKVITQLGGAIILVTISILCVIFVKRKKYKLTIPLNLIIIVILNIVLKNIFERPRPNELRIIEETGFSFPSGHSMASMAFYGYLIYLIYTNVKNKRLKYTLCILLSILVFLIGLSRIYLGVHYVSDVIAGFCFSMAYLILMISIGIYE